MKESNRCVVWIALMAVAWVINCCTLFKTAEKVEKAAEKVTEKIDEGKKGSSAGGQTQPEPEHEGPLLDNKVSALRIQDALRKAGAGYSAVQATGTKEGVTLSGTVRTEAERTKAVEIAKGAHRQVRLKNEITVKGR